MAGATFMVKHGLLTPPSSPPLVPIASPSVPNLLPPVHPRLMHLVEPPTPYEHVRTMPTVTVLNFCRPPKGMQSAKERRYNSAPPRLIQALSARASCRVFTDYKQCKRWFPNSAKIVIVSNDYLVGARLSSVSDDVVLDGLNNVVVQGGVVIFLWRCFAWPPYMKYEKYLERWQYVFEHLGVRSWTIHPYQTSGRVFLNPGRKSSSLDGYTRYLPTQRAGDGYVPKQTCLLGHSAICLKDQDIIYARNRPLERDLLRGLGKDKLRAAMVAYRVLERQVEVGPDGIPTGALHPKGRVGFVGMEEADDDTVIGIILAMCGFRALEHLDDSTRELL